MAQFVVRNLEDPVKRGIEERARQHGHSTEEEVREILRAAVASDRRAPITLGTSIAARFAKVGLDAEIPELRGSRARPAKLR